MYCTSCGREIKSKFNCIHYVKLSKIEKVFLFILIIIFPMFTYVTLFNLNGLNYIKNKYIFIGNYTLIIMMSVIIVLSIIFKKNYLALFFNCHQLVSRSIKIKGKHFIICARCSGIFFGIFFSPIIISFIDESIYYLILGIPLLLDGSLQYFTNYRSNNLKRLITGFSFSITFVYIFSYYQLLLILLTNYLADFII